MSVTITFTADTPEAMERQLLKWEDVLCKGRLTIEAANQSNALAAQAQMAAARAVKEEAQRAEAHASNVKALKEMAAKAVVFAAEPVEEPVSGPFPVAAAKDEAPSTASPAADTSGATSAEAPSDVPPYDEVMVAVLDVANAFSKDEALAMLSKFGAKRASDIDPSRWADVIAAAQALLKAA
jgi:hypothetical protein